MIELLLGGTRSGKSQVAERRLAGEDAVTYLAPTVVDGDDADWVARIAAHAARRPAGWTTVECGVDLAGALDAATGAVLIDSLGSWVSAAPDLDIDVEPVVAALVARRTAGLRTVVVSEEVGLAPHDALAVVRSFVDVLGRVNAAVSAVADAAHLVVAGRTLALELPDDA